MHLDEVIEGELIGLITDTDWLGPSVARIMLTDEAIWMMVWSFKWSRLLDGDRNTAPGYRWHAKDPAMTWIKPRLPEMKHEYESYQRSPVVEAYLAALEEEERSEVY